MTKTIVVSGFGRSGTSLMMQLLEGLGVPLLVSPPGDPSVPAADEFNECGYYEYGPINFKCNAAIAVENARGKAVKLCIPRVDHLPWDREYFMIWMNRDFNESLESRRRCATVLDSLGNPTGALTLEQMKATFRATTQRFRFNPAITTMDVYYSMLLGNPVYAERVLDRIIDETSYEFTDKERALAQIQPRLRHVHAAKTNRPTR